MEFNGCVERLHRSYAGAHPAVCASSRVRLHHILWPSHGNQDGGVTEPSSSWRESADTLCAASPLHEYCAGSLHVPSHGLLSLHHVSFPCSNNGRTPIGLAGTSKIVGYV
jgi:hypothetical protein